jgi:hypothetical protein
MQQACTPDVMRLCNDDVPDVDALQIGFAPGRFQRGRGGRRA